MYGVARDPLEDETPQERELFGQALSVAVATAVAANASEVEAEARIRERRQRIWKSVDTQRHRARWAVTRVRAAERLAESEVRRDKPELAHFCDAARQQEERALERTQHFQALAEQVRQTRNRSPRLTKEEGRWIDGLLADMERETESLAAWLDMVRCRRHQPGSAPDDGDRTPPARGGKDLDAGLQYEKVLQEVIKLRRVVAAIAAERRRAEDILSDEARRTANHSPAFRVAETEMHAALAELLTSLLHKAMLPEMHALIADSHRA